MKDITKKYSNGEVTIVWKPAMCIHSAICFNGLGDVFHPQELPWITPEKSTTDKIINQIKKCPSGALSYYLNRDAGNEEVKSGGRDDCRNDTQRPIDGVWKCSYQRFKRQSHQEKQRHCVLSVWRLVQ